MPPTKPFRFGVVGGGATAQAFGECARRAEELGYSVFLSPDHLDLGGTHFTELAPLPSLAYAAAVTSTIRLGTSVLNHDFRHPAVLARDVATLDVLCGGRFELGLGAGHTEYEYEWAGIPFDDPGLRVGRFEEYVRVVRSLLQQESTTHHGEHFRITEMPGIPRPVQAPRMPIMIGATRKRMLAIAVREADIVGINLNDHEAGTAARMDEAVAWVREVAGDTIDRLELNTVVGTLVVGEGDRHDILARELARDAAAGRAFMTAGMTEDEILESPIALIGSVEQLVEEIESWRERWGVSYVMVTFPMLERFAPVVERLAGR